MEPGAIVLDIQRKGHHVVIRYVSEGDVVPMYEYINELSREQTYVSYQGEEISMEEEERHVVETVKKIRSGHDVNLLLWVDDRLCGICNITLGVRVNKHVGMLGLSLNMNMRGLGLGRLLIETSIEEATMRMTDMKIIELTVFAINDVALTLYKSCGFVQAGRIPDRIMYKGQYVDEILMYKKV